MAFEQRGQSGWYYYRCWRDEDGRVRKQYIGGGAVGEIAAAADVQRRAQQRAERKRLEDLDQAARELERITTAVFRGSMLLSGYHRHHGCWQRRRKWRKKP